MAHLKKRVPQCFDEELRAARRALLDDGFFSENWSRGAASHPIARREIPVVVRSNDRLGEHAFWGAGDMTKNRGYYAWQKWDRKKRVTVGDLVVDFFMAGELESSVTFERQKNSGERVAARKVMYGMGVVSCFDFWGMHQQDWEWYSRLDEGVCFWCAVSFGDCDKCRGEVDHILPVSSGGDNRRCNLAPCCRRCNGGMGKGSMSPRAWLDEMDRLWRAGDLLHPCWYECETIPF